MTACRRWLKAAALVVAALAGGTLAPLSATAATTVPFTARMYLCSFEPSTDRMSGGGILHFRGAVNHNLWVATTPLVTGWEDNVVNGNINLADSSGVAQPHSVMRPFAYNGTWDVIVHVTVSPTGLDAHGEGHGTGALHGRSIRFHQTGAIDLQPGENPCSDLFLFASTLAGEVLIPGPAA